ncbi:MAG: deoxyribonuclease V [Anaerolineales bacterium]|nr:deoxyribonuclease V [Anaerolineales bacterium]
MPIPHDWKLSATEAIALQKELAHQVDATTPIPLETMRYVAGVDVSVKNEVSRAAIVVLTYPDLEVVEAVTATMPTPFPYISGLLSFREGAVILEAHEKLTIQPDAYIFDGQGIAHPRRLGIAAHIGLWLDRPTLGCGKTWLIGAYTDPTTERGSYSPMVDKGDVIGMVVRTRTRVKPVFISVGHKATLDTAVELALRCTTKYRLPEPIRHAHNTAGQYD